MEAHEFTWDEKNDYKGILRAVESAANYAMECDYWMTRTLAELRQQIERLIQQQGEESPVAAWIYTKEDVLDYPDDAVVDEEVATKVINNLDQYDYIYTKIFECIDEELRQANVI